jgi:uncharacterized protein
MTNVNTLLGMDRHTGKAITGFDHVRQSIHDILTTSVGERVLNRSYGSDLLNAIDAPMGEGLVQYIYAATALAIAEHYPFVGLGRITVENADTPASMVITITGEDASADGLSFDLAIPFALTPPTLN